MGALMVLQSVAKLGGDRDKVLAQVGLPADRLRDPEAHIPLSTHHQLWETALEESHDRALPLRVAEACTPATFSVLGYVCMTAANVREALDRLTRFLSLFLQGETITLELVSLQRQAGP